MNAKPSSADTREVRESDLRKLQDLLNLPRRSNRERVCNPIEVNDLAFDAGRLLEAMKSYPAYPHNLWFRSRPSGDLPKFRNSLDDALSFFVDWIATGCKVGPSRLKRHALLQHLSNVIQCEENPRRCRELAAAATCALLCAWEDRQRFEVFPEVLVATQDLKTVPGIAGVLDRLHTRRIDPTQGEAKAEIRSLLEQALGENSRRTKNGPTQCAETAGTSNTLPHKASRSRSQASRGDSSRKGRLTQAERTKAEALAIQCAALHEDWTKETIARHVGVSTRTLQRWEQFSAVLKNREQQARARRRGSISLNPRTREGEIQRERHDAD